MVEFFVNPPEGADHSLNASNRKSDNTFTSKTFKNKKLLCLRKKKFQVKINSSMDFVFFQLPDLQRDLTTFQKRAAFDKISKKIAPIA